MKLKFIHCVSCGRFIGYQNSKVVYYEPDSHFGPEKIEWMCGRCVEKTNE